MGCLRACAVGKKVAEWRTVRNYSLGACGRPWPHAGIASNYLYESVDEAFGCTVPEEHVVKQETHGGRSRCDQDGSQLPLWWALRSPWLLINVQALPYVGGLAKLLKLCPQLSLVTVHSLEITSVCSSTTCVRFGFLQTKWTASRTSDLRG